MQANPSIYSLKDFYESLILKMHNVSVNQMTFIKKSNSCMDEYDEFASNVSIRSNRVRCKAKRSTWSRLFCRQPAEEEFVLLPMFAKEKDQIKVVKKSLTQPEQKDWWLRYFSSDKVS